MPTRSGLDYHKINPQFFICAYCYQAYDSIPGVWRHEGMITKRQMLRIDESVNDFAMVPDSYVKIWTEPHCLACNRKVRGFEVSINYLTRYKYPSTE